MSREEIFGLKTDSVLPVTLFLPVFLPLPVLLMYPAKNLLSVQEYFVLLYSVFP